MPAEKTNGTVAQYVQAWMQKVAILLWMVLFTTITTVKIHVSVDFSSHVYLMLLEKKCYSHVLST